MAAEPREHQQEPQEEQQRPQGADLTAPGLLSPSTQPDARTTASATQQPDPSLPSTSHHSSPAPISLSRAGGVTLQAASDGRRTGENPDKDESNAEASNAGNADDGNGGEGPEGPERPVAITVEHITAPSRLQDEHRQQQLQQQQQLQVTGASLATRLRNHSRTLKSTATGTSSPAQTSSQPIIVRTYSGSTSRASSLGGRSPAPSSSTAVTRRVAMSDDVSHPHQHSQQRQQQQQIPPVEAFSFRSILQNIDPEIQGALDAIAEIYARSKLSLADEYSAHLPPQGEIMAGSAAGRHHHAHQQHGVSNHPYRSTVGMDNTLAAVPEASSSSERLASESKKLATPRQEEPVSEDNAPAEAIPDRPMDSGLNDVGSGFRGISLVDTRIEGSDARVTGVALAHPKGHHGRSKSASWTVTTGGHPAVALLSADLPMAHLTTDQLSQAAVTVMMADHTDRPQRRMSAVLPSTSHNQAPRSRFLFLGTWLPGWGQQSQQSQPARSGASDASAEARLRVILQSAAQASDGKYPQVPVH